MTIYVKKHTTGKMKCDYYKALLVELKGSDVLHLLENHVIYVCLIYMRDKVIIELPMHKE